MHILKAVSIFKEFSQGQETLQVLKGPDMTVQQGEALCIVGPSGAGKSTFLHILGALDQATAGEIFYKNKKLSSALKEEKAEFRAQKLGFVFQFHYLLNEFNMIENIMIAGQVAGMSVQQSRENAEYLMNLLNLSHRWKHFPSELSGGERQRTAIARALMNQPEILLVDEPTGALDTENAMKILDLLFEMRERLGLTLIAVSHDPLFSGPFPKKLTMKDGQWV